MSTSDLARRAPETQSIEQQQSRGLTFATVADMTGYSLPQIAMIRHNMALSMRVVPDEVPLYDIALFCHSCRSLGLDPLLKQAYWISRQGKGALQIGIDGYRALADRQGNYAGSSEPVFRGTIEWEHRGRTVVVPDYCQVVTWKIVAGQRCSFVGEARWTEYVPRANGAGAESDMWAKMPRNQLAKCFDEQTEVLTDRGFQRFADVTGRVLQVTEHGLKATDSRPFSQAYDGPMVRLDSDDLNFSVTPNHDMLTSDGKVEAGEMYERARASARVWIPRCVQETGSDWSLDDAHIRLAAAYIADGSDSPGLGFKIEVSRAHKVSALREIGLHREERLRAVAGQQAATATRTITTRSDKASFVYAFDQVDWLCERGKQVKIRQLLLWSKRQARTFVDALVEFDGSTNKQTGVRRFYTSRLDHLAVFELAAIIAGYAVSSPTIRRSDIDTKPNFQITISSRSQIPVIRWGRPSSRSKGNARNRTGLTLQPNASGRVWCVTVPSGLIVVRRNGFSMVCGNCAEAQSLRKGWPAQLGGLAYDVGADAADFAIEQVPSEPQSQRPPATAAEHKRIFGSEDDGTAFADLPPRPAAPPPPVQQGDPPPAAEKDDSAAAPARSGEPATEAELAENAALVEDARSLNVKGLGPLTAKPGWPADKTREATAELRARIRSRNNELDGENAGASGQAEF